MRARKVRGPTFWLRMRRSQSRRCSSVRRTSSVCCRIALPLYAVACRNSLQRKGRRSDRSVGAPTARARLFSFAYVAGPIGGDAFLRLAEVYQAVFHLLCQIVFDRVLLLEIALNKNHSRRPALRP